MAAKAVMLLSWCLGTMYFLNQLRVLIYQSYPSPKVPKMLSKGDFGDQNEAMYLKSFYSFINII